MVDGHDIKTLVNSFYDARRSEDKPVMILAKTYKGKGLPGKDKFLVLQSTVDRSNTSDEFCNDFRKFCYRKKFGTILFKIDVLLGTFITLLADLLVRGCRNEPSEGFL